LTIYYTGAGGWFLSFNIADRRRVVHLALDDEETLRVERIGYIPNWVMGPRALATPKQLYQLILTIWKAKNIEVKKRYG